MGCTSGQATNPPTDWSARSFQTPLPHDPYYKPEYEGLGRVMCYNNIVYNNGLTSATVEVRCRQHSSINKVQYNFNKQGFQDLSKFTADKSFSSTLPVTVRGYDIHGLTWDITLEPLNFVWQAANVPQGPEYKNGQKGAIIEMFGWPYADIKAECAALGKMGWMGVKVFPPQESVFSYEWPQNGELNPWWFYYQPVSYRLDGRHGNRE
jgi:alpha-amylase